MGPHTYLHMSKVCQKCIQKPVIRVTSGERDWECCVKVNCIFPFISFQTTGIFNLNPLKKLIMIPNQLNIESQFCP